MRQVDGVALPNQPAERVCELHLVRLGVPGTDGGFILPTRKAQGTVRVPPRRGQNDCRGAPNTPRCVGTLRQTRTQLPWLLRCCRRRRAWGPTARCTCSHNPLRVRVGPTKRKKTQTHTPRQRLFRFLDVVQDGQHKLSNVDVFVFDDDDNEAPHSLRMRTENAQNITHGQHKAPCGQGSHRVECPEAFVDCTGLQRLNLRRKAIGDSNRGCRVGSAGSRVDSRCWWGGG